MKKKLGLVQVFRGIAAVLVVLCHLSGSTESYFNTAFLGDFFLKGYIGVDFFFVLSGFIITYVHFNDLHNGSNKLAFLKKRFVRIYPFYWVVVSVYVILLFMAGGKTKHLDHTIDFLSARDLAFLFGSYLLIPMNSNPLLGVTWSLTYEILFYLVFFAFISIGFKKAKYILPIWTAIILTKALFPSFNTIPDVMLFNSRIIQFLSGCVVAYLIIKSYRPSLLLQIFLGIAAFISILFVFPDSLKEPIGILALAFVMGLIVFAIVDIDIRKEKHYPKFLLLLGEASYAIYLSHLIFLSILLRVFKIFIEKVSIDDFLVVQMLILIMFVTITGLGILTHLFVEVPILKFFNKKWIHNAKPINRLEAA